MKGNTMNTESIETILEEFVKPIYVPSVRPTRATAHLPRKYQNRSKPYGDTNPLNQTITEEEWRAKYTR
jgi:hypothetical protein